MSDLTPGEAAQTALFWGAVTTGLKPVAEAARADALKALSEAQIGSQRVLDADGVDLGTVSWRPPSAADPAVTDERALLAWVKRNRPEEVVVTETVRSSFVDALIGRAKAAPEGVPILEGGEVVPGITVPQGTAAGRLTVRPTPEAKLRIHNLMQGAISALRERTPELPGGPESV